MKHLVVGILAVALTTVAVAQIKRTPSPAGAEVYIIAPQDGASVKSPVTIKFGLKASPVV